MKQPQLWLGGSFNPIHLGHLQLASTLASRLACRVSLLPSSAQSAFGKQLAATRYRQEMLRLAITEFPALQLDERELEQPGRCFTIDTLRSIRQENQPDANLTFVLGADLLITLDRWKQYQQILNYANLIILQRDSLHDPISSLLERLSGPIQRVLRGALTTDEQVWRNNAHGKVLFWHNPLMSISSTDVRNLARKNQRDALQELVSPLVFEYLCEVRPYS